MSAKRRRCVAECGLAVDEDDRQAARAGRAAGGQPHSMRPARENFLAEEAILAAIWRQQGCMVLRNHGQDRPPEREGSLISRSDESKSV